MYLIEYTSYNSPHVLAMLALQPNQAEVKNVELNDLGAGYMIPIKLKPSETLACDITFFYTILRL